MVILKISRKIVIFVKKFSMLRSLLRVPKTWSDNKPDYLWGGPELTYDILQNF